MIPAHNEKQPLGILPLPLTVPEMILWEITPKKPSSFQFLLLKGVAWGFQRAGETGLFGLHATDLPDLPGTYTAHWDGNLRITLTILWASRLLCPNSRYPRQYLLSWLSCLTQKVVRAPIEPGF